MTITGALVTSRRAAFVGLACVVAGCQTVNDPMVKRPQLAWSSSLQDLLSLPPPRYRLDTAVFRFLDQTGQHKPNQTFADYSFAVTQGASNLLIQTLHEAGSGNWFRVVERSNVGDLLQERQIIRANRIEYAGPDKKPLPELGPLLNAGIIFEGGIVGYDTNVVTGGIGANYLGIGANVQYQRDTVSVSLRTVSTLTGEVLTAVETTKTVYSALIDGSIFRYVGFNKLLQVETGFSTNEPVTVCVTQAIELAVYSTIMEGAIAGIWAFADPEVQTKLETEYLRTNNGRTAYPPQRPPPSARASPPAPVQR
ncbi:MAG TPA: CsgG/HfaB family protein [Chloroflexota bacterium]|jgi:curli production assembly/transport component CsgG